VLTVVREFFKHSFNYRSVMVLGRTRLVSNPDEKAAALDAVVEHIVPGRSGAVRAATRKELAATVVLAVPLAEVSAKVRTGGAKDEDEDLPLPIWSGVLPLRLVSEPAVPEADGQGLPVPEHVVAWRRPAPAKEL
jgi:uncharacterized protein